LGKFRSSQSADRGIFVFITYYLFASQEKVDVIARVRTTSAHRLIAGTAFPAKAESTGTWPAGTIGTIGTVVSDYGDHKMIEIVGSIRPTRQKRRKPQRAAASRSSIA
jgi:hypothetical protein